MGNNAFPRTEHKVVLSTDAEHARAIGRKKVQKFYLGLSNYVSNLKRLGSLIPTSPSPAATG